MAPFSQPGSRSRSRPSGEPPPSIIPRLPAPVPSPLVASLYLPLSRVSMSLVRRAPPPPACLPCLPACLPACLPVRPSCRFSPCPPPPPLPPPPPPPRSVGLGVPKAAAVADWRLGRRRRQQTHLPSRAELAASCRCFRMATKNGESFPTKASLDFVTLLADAM